MWIEVIICVFVTLLYFLCYVDMKISKSDDIYYYDKLLTRKDLNRETFLKSPFYFDGTHLNDSIDKTQLEKKDKKKNVYTSYTKLYTSIVLLEPHLRFKPETEVFYVDKHLPIHTNQSSFNYYIIKEGSCKITFIHPKFRDNFYDAYELKQTQVKIDYIKKHNHFKTIVFEKNSIIYVPNDWILFIENNETTRDKSKSPKSSKSSKPCIIEIIRYRTLCNQIIGWIKNNLIKQHKKE